MFQAAVSAVTAAGPSKEEPEPVISRMRNVCRNPDQRRKPNETKLWQLSTDLSRLIGDLISGNSPIHNHISIRLSASGTAKVVPPQ